MAIAKVLSTAIMVWFFILVCTVNILFDELKNRLETMVDIGLNNENAAEELKAWKKHHALVCQMVTCINISFGLNLVVAFAHGFVTFITNFYRFIANAEGGPIFVKSSFLLIFIQQAIFLSIFIIASYRLQSWVL